MGEVMSIVGPTGSGKTALINDIGLFPNFNTPSQRRVLINDAEPSEDFLDDPAKNPIALITQHADHPPHQFSVRPVAKMTQALREWFPSGAEPKYVL